MGSDNPAHALLVGYEQLTDFGFALLLYKTRPNSNAWYCAAPEKPYDAKSYVSRFDLHHPEQEEYFDADAIQEIRIGDPYPSVFFWEGRAHIGSPEAILSSLRDHVRDVEKYTPMSLTDLSLYARSRQLRRHASTTYSYLTSRFGAQTAHSWFGAILVRQAAMLDIDKLVTPLRHALERAQSQALTNAIAKIRTSVAGRSIVRIEARGLVDYVDLQQLARARLPLTHAVCRAVSATYELAEMSADDVDVLSPTERRVPRGMSLTRKVSSGGDELHISVSGKGMHAGAALLTAASERVRQSLAGLGILRGSASVTFSRASVGVKCSIAFNARQQKATARATEGNAYDALQSACERLMQQIRRTRSQRRLDRHGARSLKLQIGASFERRDDDDDRSTSQDPSDAQDPSDDQH